MGKQKIQAILLLILFSNTYGLVSEPYQNVKKWASRIVIGTVIGAIPTLCFIWRHDIAKSLLTVLPEPSRNSLPPQLPRVQPMIPTPRASIALPQKSNIKTEKQKVDNLQEVTPALLQQMRAGLKKQENSPLNNKQPKNKQDRTRINSNNRYAKLWYQWEQEREDS